MQIERTRSPRPRPAAEKLGFGQHFTDHMLRMDYASGRWGEPGIVPYGPLVLDPAAAVLHYAQTIFEGLKAYAGDPTPRLFRPQAHAARLTASASRLCMPAIPPELFIENVKAIVRADADWMPEGQGTALYVRPIVMATEAFLGVRPANQYAFLVLLSPVGAYWPGGLSAVRIWVEEEQLRAARGGLGAAKTGGNYAASLFAAERAKSRGYQQVLWLDQDRRYVEEVGTMNVCFVFGDTLVTPPTSDSLLAGITRDSVLQLARSWKVKIEERPVEIGEIADAAKKGTLREAFGTGTAAVISPIAELGWREQKIVPGDGKPGPLAQRLHAALTGITSGREPDPFGWMVSV